MTPPQPTRITCDSLHYRMRFRADSGVEVGDLPVPWLTALPAASISSMSQSRTASTQNVHDWLKEPGVVGGHHPSCGRRSRRLAGPDAESTARDVASCVRFVTMSDQLVEELRASIGKRSAVVIVGAGVSMASTTKKDISWVGLLENAAAYAQDVNAGLPVPWAASVASDIEMGRAGYSTSLLSAAEKIEDALGGTAGADLRTWLRREFGDLRPESTGLLEAIGALGIPILTTNYDLFLEGVCGGSAITWQDPPSMQQIITGDSTDIGHLHGHWKQAESVILSNTSYVRLQADDSAQAIQKAFASTKSVLYVGFGEGLSDPNFSRLREWLKDTLGQSEVRHYRLCLARELGALVKEHAGESIKPVVYGDVHSDLASFIEGLRPADGASAQLLSSLSSSRAGYKRIITAAQSNCVLAEHMTADSAQQIQDFYAPPILLPVPHEEFAAARQKGEKIERSDAEADRRNCKLLMIVGEESSGLTSSLNWMLSRSYEEDRTAVPVLLDFRSLQSGTYPLDRAIRTELASLDIDVSRDDPLPPISLAVDNMVIRKSILKKFARELGALNLERVFIACRRGLEPELLNALEAEGLTPAIRYLGRLNQEDVRFLARLVAPSIAKDLADQAIRIVTREHLARTPLTFSLLLSALLRGEELLNASSGTHLLDAYVGLLLGRGSLQDDARFGLDSGDMTALLARLAQRFVINDAGALPVSDVIDEVQRFFLDVDWEEEPQNVIGDLKRRHILVSSGDAIKFAQASYLHLFAAKQALSDASFKAHLLRDALYYTSIVSHYAALARVDSEPLSVLNGLLAVAPPESFPRGSSLTSDVAPLPSGDSDLDRLLGALRLDDEGIRATSNRTVELREIDPLESVSDGDVEPFPSARMEDLSSALRLSALLALASNVLRDSERVTNLELKEELLGRTLTLWGVFVDVTENDDQYATLIRNVAERLSEDFKLDDERRQTFVEWLTQVTATFFAVGSMRANLSSTKLNRTLARCFQDPTFYGEARGSVMGAFLSLELRGSAWVRTLEKVFDEHVKVRAVQDSLFPFVLNAYYEENLSHDDEARLKKMLVKFILATRNWKDHRARQAAATSLDGRLVAARAQRRRQLAQPDTALEVDEPKAIPGSSADDLLG